MRRIGKPGHLLGSYIIACAIAAISPARAATITEYPAPAIQPNDIVLGPDNALWFQSFASQSNITRLTTDGKMTSFTVPHTPAHMIVGPDNAFWVIANDDFPTKDPVTGNTSYPHTSYIGRIDSTGAYQTIYAGPTSGPNQTSISFGSLTKGPDGAVWFTALNAAHPIERVDQNGNISQVDITAYSGAAHPFPYRIATGSDGALWITDLNQGKIYRVTTDGQSKEFSAKGVGSNSITAGPDGAMWFGGNVSPSSSISAHVIGRIAQDGTLTTFKVNGSPVNIIAGKDNDLWFTQTIVTADSTDGPIGYGAIGHITTTGTVTDYKISDVDSRPWGLALDSDGNVWFTEEAVQKIGRLSISDKTGFMPLHASTVFSSTQAAKNQSFLRFYNGETLYPGTVTVTLYDGSGGNLLAQWTSPQIAPGAAQQFSIATVEANTITPLVNKPPTYTLVIQPAMRGSFAHVVWNPNAGVLSNVSTCSAGINANPTTISFVHSSNVAGYPSSIVITNTGGVGQSVTLGIADANTGKKIDTYTTALIPSNGQLVVPVDQIEAAMKFKPDPLQGWYIVSAQQPFTGYLQHLVTNTQANAAITDMTAACTMAPAS